jgi:hypothetical protein
MATYGASESWDDHGDAQTEMSVAPAKRGGVEANSARAPAAAATGGYSAEELAALAEAEDDGEGTSRLGMLQVLPQLLAAGWQCVQVPVHRLRYCLLATPHHILPFIPPPSSDDWGQAPAAHGAPQYGQPQLIGASYGSGGGGGGAYGGGYGPVPGSAPPQGSAPAGEVLCPTCSNPCYQRTSNTPKNPGRQALLVTLDATAAPAALQCCITCSSLPAANANSPVAQHPAPTCALMAPFMHPAPAHAPSTHLRIEHPP